MSNGNGGAMMSRILDQILRLMIVLIAAGVLWLSSAFAGMREDVRIIKYQMDTLLQIGIADRLTSLEKDVEHLEATDK